MTSYSSPVTGYKKIAVIGANGMLASMLCDSVPKSVTLHRFDLPELDITDADQLNTTFAELKPDVVINCAAFTQVDACESQREMAFQVNGAGPGHLATVARNIGAVLVHVSTDFVFSGARTTPYVEDDMTEPISAYGESKLQGEQAILASGLSDYYIIRTSWLYGPGGPNFVETIIRLATEREELGIVTDQFGTPTYTGDLAAAIWRLISPITSYSSPVTQHQSQITAPYGIYHYSNSGVCSWYEFACAIVEQLRNDNASLKLRELKPITTAEYPLPAERPSYSVLSKEKYKQVTGDEISDWRYSLDRYFKNRS